MKKMILLLISIIIATSITGCATQINESMQSMIGYHYSEVVGQWGPPTRTIDDGSGNKMMVWEKTHSSTTAGSAKTEPYGFLSRPSYQTTYTPPKTTTHTKSRTYWINKDGIIYNWAWKGF